MHPINYKHNPDPANRQMQLKNESPPTVPQYVSIECFFFYLPTVWSQLQCQIMGRAKWVENGTNQNLDPTRLLDFYTQHRPILHRLGTVNFAPDRLTAR